MSKGDKAFIKDETEWLRSTGKDFDVVISSRVRLARNLANYTYPGFMTVDDERAVNSEIVSAFKNLPNADKFSILYLDNLKPLERKILLEKNLITQEMSLAKDKIFILSEDGELSVMVNIDDHLRLTCLKGGAALKEAYQQVNALDNLLEGHNNLDFAFSVDWGYLNSNLFNLGTGMKASLMFHLPALVMTSLINKAVKAITEIGLAVKGFFNDNMTSLGDVYQVSNQLSIGQSESEIIDNMLKVAGPLINYERRAREEVLSKRRIEIEDSVYRALGILTNCRTISIREAIELLSRVRLGISLDLIKDIDLNTVTHLFFITQKSHVQRLAEENKEKVDIKLIDYMRAKIIRDKIKIKKEGSENDV